MRTGWKRPICTVINNAKITMLSSGGSVLQGQTSYVKIWGEETSRNVQLLSLTHLLSFFNSDLFTED